VHNTGDTVHRAEVVAAIEHELSDRTGDSRVTIVGSRGNDHWQMKVEGPNAFERLYTLVGADGEHRPEVIRVLLTKMVAGAKQFPRINASP
jgi:glycine cleavage system aminomethyltransferase T